MAGAIVLSRAQHEPEAAVAVAWMGSVYAAVAGLMLVTDGGLLRPPGGRRRRAARWWPGWSRWSGLGEGRTLVIPPVVVGAIFLATGLVMRAATFDPAVVLTTALVLVVLAGSVFPWLALGATGTTVDQLYSTADITADPDEIDPARVGADARVAHEILVGRLGDGRPAAGAGRPARGGPRAWPAPCSPCSPAWWSCCGPGSTAPAPRSWSGWCPASSAWSPSAVSMLWMHPDWRPTAAVVLAATGAVLLARDAAAVDPVGAPRPARRRRRDGLPCSSCCRCSWSPPASSPRSGAEPRWPPSGTSSRRTRSAGGGWSRRSCPARPAAVRSSPRGPAAPSSAGWRWPCCSSRGRDRRGVRPDRDPQDWNKPGLVVSKETGAAYVILEESRPTRSSARSSTSPRPG